MASLDELLRPFAASVYAKACALRRLRLDERQRRRFLEAIADDIKKCSNFVEPEVSVATAELAGQRGVDLRQMDWHDQHRFDRGRTAFHFEHIVPVADISTKCQAGCTAEDVLRILRENLRVAWILKEEDRRLTQLGYRSRRPDPEAAYRRADIKLLPRGPVATSAGQSTARMAQGWNVVRQASLPVAAIEELRVAVGWDRCRGVYDRVLLGSYAHYSISAGSLLVAFLNVISDGVADALLVDVMMHPDFQHRGIGRALVQRALEDLRADGIRCVQVVFERALEPFYRSCGFQIEMGGIIDGGRPSD